MSETVTVLIFAGGSGDGLKYLAAKDGAFYTAKYVFDGVNKIKITGEREKDYNVFLCQSRGGELMNVNLLKKEQWEGGCWANTQSVVDFSRVQTVRKRVCILIEGGPKFQFVHGEKDRVKAVVRFIKDFTVNFQLKREGKVKIIAHGLREGARTAAKIIAELDAHFQKLSRTMPQNPSLFFEESEERIRRQNANRPREKDLTKARISNNVELHLLALSPDWQHFKSGKFKHFSDLVKTVTFSLSKENSHMWLQIFRWFNRYTIITAYAEKMGERTLVGRIVSGFEGTSSKDYDAYVERVSQVLEAHLTTKERFSQHPQTSQKIDLHESLYIIASLLALTDAEYDSFKHPFQKCCIDVHPIFISLPRIYDRKYSPAFLKEIIRLRCILYGIKKYNRELVFMPLPSRYKIDFFDDEMKAQAAEEYIAHTVYNFPDDIGKIHFNTLATARAFLFWCKEHRRFLATPEARARVYRQIPRSQIVKGVILALARGELDEAQHMIWHGSFENYKAKLPGKNRITSVKNNDYFSNPLRKTEGNRKTIALSLEDRYLVRELFEDLLELPVFGVIEKYCPKRPSQKSLDSMK